MVFPLRAIAATLAFTLAGLLGFLFAPHLWELKAPNAIFYFVLVLNTFFSVRFFDALPPQGRDERVIDGILTALYLALAATIGWLLPFAVVATLLFAAATMKYVLLLPVMDRRDILYRKILIDALGFIMCLAALAATVWSDPFWAAWGVAFFFALANVYLLAVQPMYVDPRTPRSHLPDMKEARRTAPLDR